MLNGLLGLQIQILLCFACFVAFCSISSVMRSFVQAHSAFVCSQATATTSWIQRMFRAGLLLLLALACAQGAATAQQTAAGSASPSPSPSPASHEPTPVPLAKV